jgi:head-tail adaptor
MPEFVFDEGRATKRISVISAPTGANALNEATTDGTLVGKAWAELNPDGSATSRDFARQGGDGVQSIDTWRVRYRSAFTENMSITWNSQTWRIASIDILGSKVAMDIRAVRVA